MDPDIVERCFPQAEYEVRRTAEPATVEGRPASVVEESAQGNGKRAGWEYATWLVDPATCRRVGLTLRGSLGSYTQDAQLIGAPTPGEQAWLLARAGFTQWIPASESHAIATWVYTPRSPGTDSVAPLPVTRAPPLTWHSGPVPTFTEAWRPYVDRDGQRWEIVSADALFATSERGGGLIFHTFTTAARAPHGVEIVEDPARHRWAIAAPYARGGRIAGAAPAPLGDWYWTERQTGELDPGINSVVATDLATGARWTFHLELVDHATWVPEGLKLEPFDGEGMATVISTDVLLRALAE
jgi:hypothetical protein